MDLLSNIASKNATETVQAFAFFVLLVKTKVMMMIIIIGTLSYCLLINDGIHCLLVYCSLCLVRWVFRSLLSHIKDRMTVPAISMLANSGTSWPFLTGDVDDDGVVMMMMTMMIMVIIMMMIDD